MAVGPPLFWRTFVRTWNAVFGARGEKPEVIVHDPGAQGPKNLDNPFIDPKAQDRVGKLIAGQSSKKSSSENI
jgi:hypothetical protein